MGPAGLDENGDPAMAYLVIDPNGDGDESDNTLCFVSWNRAAYPGTHRCL